MSSRRLIGLFRTMLLLPLSVLAFAQPATPVPDVSLVRPGAAAVETSANTLSVAWPDEAGRTWQMVFSLDARPALIKSISVAGKQVLENINPVYSAQTGVRRGGWDQFFDFPPSHPDGTRQFQATFRPVTAVARSRGERVEVEFAGMNLGVFS